MNPEILNVETLENPTPVTVSKKKLRKQRNYAKRLESRKLKRLQERKVRKSKPNPPRRPNDKQKQETISKLSNALNNGPKIVIDCQYGSLMSLKESSRFAQQLRRCYSSNKNSEHPVHLYFTSLSEGTDFFNLCCKINDGFSKYIVDRRSESFLEVFSEEKKLEQLVYLSPDSVNVLSEFDPSKIYIIGGLVDETTKSNISKDFTTKESIPSARLPIQEYFTKGPAITANKSTFKIVLTVNQVFDIILTWYKTKDWIQAIKAGLPERTGFIPKEEKVAEKVGP